MISALMVAGLLAACSSPSGSSSDSDKDKDKKQNGEQQGEEESGESENLNEKKAQILKQMLGTYKPEGSESLEIKILKDKIVISQYGAENEISISKLQLAQELDAEGDTNAGYVVNGFFEGSDGKQYLFFRRSQWPPVIFLNLRKSIKSYKML